MTVYCDSQRAICLAKSSTFYAQNKHIDVQYNFAKNMAEYGMMKLLKVETLMNVTKSLTKVVSTKKFKWYSNSMGLMAPSNNLWYR